MSTIPVAPGGGPYPSDVQTQLLPGEQVEYFSYLSQKGGCLRSAKRDEHWIAITPKRMLYKALVNVKEKKQIVERDGIIPLSKVSIVEVTEVKGTGCLAGKAFELRIHSSGSEVGIPLATREKGIEVRSVYSQLNDRAGNQ